MALIQKTNKNDSAQIAIHPSGSVFPIQQD
jgi:hypothetical protein